jgi:hypothetical protein
MIGVPLTYLGAAGEISGTAGVVSTWGGISIMTAGLILGVYSASATRETWDAIVDVKLRIRAINSELNSIRYGGRR